MDKTKIELTLIPHKIEYNGEEFLGIPTGIVGKSFSITKISQLKNRPGWIIRGESIEEWKIKGFCKIGNEIFLYGPVPEGKPLEELLTLPTKDFLPYFKNLVSSLLVLKNNSIPLFQISTHSVFFLDDGGILFLPPEVFKELIDLRSFKDKVRVFAVYNHPDRSGENNLCFSLGVLLYKVITGSYPFFSEQEEELHHMMRALSITSPSLSEPGLKESAVRMIESTLHTSAKTIPDLKEWLDGIQTWMNEGITSDLSEEKKQMVREAAQQKKEMAARQFQFRVFWNQNFIKIAVISIIVLAVGSIAGVTIKNIFFRTRVTAGLSPEELVYTYYDSMNSLDYLTISDCVMNDAGKSDVRTVMNLFVMTRQRSAYEQGPVFISAKKWDEQGRPLLEPFLPMFGVTNLKILDHTYEPEPIFTVSYEKWSTETEVIDQQSFTGTVHYFGYSTEARLFLKKDKTAWVIYRIDILKEERLSPPE